MTVPISSIQPQNARQPRIELTDTFNRPMQDLRVSVIDRCNFRCTYCMPPEDEAHYSFLKKEEWLTFEEIVRLVRLFVSCGVTKVRLTGGEPLLRPDLPDLIERLTPINGIEDLALTTNGSLLAAYAHKLRTAGLKRLTVSLDALEKDAFAKLSGGRGQVKHVIDGIRAAETEGFRRIKINVVVKKGVNDGHIMDLVEHFKGSGHILRFIEYMDVGNCNHWDRTHVVPSADIVRLISQRYPLKPADPNYFGEVAERYVFEDGSGEIGFISSVTQPFCGTCTRARLSTDGKFYTCLFATQGTDLGTALRAGSKDEELLGMIRSVWQKRGDKYSENRSLFQSLKQRPPKVEMFQIGG